MERKNVMLGKFTTTCTIGGGGKRVNLCELYKSLLAALIIIFTALSVISVPVSAAADESDFEYTVTDGAVDITKYKGSGGNVLIPDTIGGVSVTSIRALAFQSCSSLTSVTIPDSVTYIGHSAFQGCSNLTSVTMSNNLNSIGIGIFENCSSLKSITIPDSLDSITQYAFKGCSSLTSVTMPNSVTFIGNYVFNGCSSLTSITIPYNVESVGNYVFDGCSSLKTITLTSELAQYVRNANIPSTTTRIEYEVNDGEVTVTDITPRREKSVEIHDTISGLPTVFVEESVRFSVSESGHTHKGGTATCTAKAKCSICDAEYGDLAAHTGGTATCTDKAACENCGNEYGDLDPTNHNYVGGKCSYCGATDPNYVPPTDSTVTDNTSSSGTEPTVTDPTETDSAGTDHTGTSPAGTAPSVPSRPSDSVPAVTTAVKTVITVTTTTAAEEEIIDDSDYTGDDVSAGTAAYSDGQELGGRIFGVTFIGILVFAGLIFAVKKLRPEK